MTKRALLVGSQICGLTGVDHDIEAISKRLADRGFTLDLRRGEAASADGFRDGLRELIGATKPDDIALIYFSGHGARVRNPSHTPAQPGSQRLLQCLVPTDWSPTEFRGILSLELSMFLAKLTEVTRNVSVVLDSCYSARMWRGAVRHEDMRARVLGGLQVDRVDEAIAQLSRQGLAGLDPESNPHAIRLVAAEADRSAYELPIELDGSTQIRGVLTATLCELLDELASTPITWRTLALLVRERVMFHYELQRPELEGPGNRLVFEAGTASIEGGVAYFNDEGEPSLRTNRLLGAELGARYAILGAGQHTLCPGAVVAEATIQRFEGTCARAHLERREGAPEPTNGALAFMLESPLGKRGVRVHGRSGRLEALREAITASKFVTEVEHGALLEVVSSDEGFALRSVNGDLLSHVSQNIDRTLRALESWAKADILRTMGHNGLDDDYRLTWGRVVAGELVRMHAGDTAHVGDGIYLRFENRSEQALFFSAIDIGIDGEVSLLTKASPTGTKVEAGASYTLGFELRQTGLKLSWPKRVPMPESSQTLPESIVVIVAAGQHDFRTLETGTRSTQIPNSPLSQLLVQIGNGGTRNLSAMHTRDPGEYAVDRIDFMVSPHPRSEER